MPNNGSEFRARAELAQARPGTADDPRGDHGDSEQGHRAERSEREPTQTAAPGGTPSQQYRNAGAAGRGGCDNDRCGSGAKASGQVQVRRHRPAQPRQQVGDDDE
ncbi:MAG: hypothetical protein ABJB47_16535 [Actinomycetota bacterium]